MTARPLKSPTKPESLPKLSVHPIESQKAFIHYQKALSQILKLHQDTLLDAQHPKIEQLIYNLSTQVPNLWLITQDEKNVLGGASLEKITPERDAYLHGISHPHYRKNKALNTAIARATFLALETAFNTYQVRKVKAQFEADNKGAKGFCWRFNFKKEAHFKNDNLVQDQLKDVVVYSLFSKTYYQTTRRKLTHVIWP